MKHVSIFWNWYKKFSFYWRPWQDLTVRWNNSEEILDTSFFFFFFLKILFSKISKFLWTFWKNFEMNTKKFRRKFFINVTDIFSWFSLFSKFSAMIDGFPKFSLYFLALRYFFIFVKTIATDYFPWFSFFLFYYYFWHRWHIQNYSFSFYFAKIIVDRLSLFILLFGYNGISKFFN